VKDLVQLITAIIQCVTAFILFRNSRKK